MANLQYDAVVVGAGPAGSAAARALAERGFATLIVDRRAEIGRPVQCAEYVPKLIMKEVLVPRSCVAHSTGALRTHLPSGQQHVLAAPGFVLNRAMFDKHLATEAVRAGADIMVRTTAVERTACGLVIRLRQEEREVSARIIVGADGVHSSVGHWIDQRNASFIAAAQCELVIDEASSETEVYFAPEYKAGYAWFFPKGQTANVGVGIDGEAGAPRAAEALELFLERLRKAGRIKRANPVAYTAGFVPVGGLTKGWTDNILLAGDAAGCVHPVTGAGILFALISGRIAGEVAAEALRASDLGLLAEYQRRRDEVIGGPIARGLASRERLCAGWTSDVTALESLLLSNWVAFEGYGEDGTRRPNGGRPNGD